ncbi:hypothetical protein GCM10027614_30710 [Micromonospora vulcania]
MASANRTSGAAPLTVAFSSAGSSDPEGGALTYSWAFGDGTTSTAANPSKTYSTNGTYTATLTVRDPQGATGTASVTISVGNTAPTVTINSPGNGQVFSFGDTVPYSITVTDPEDGTIDCTRVKMTYVLGHDQHGHQITSKNGCSGSITIPVDGEHDDAANIFAIFDAEYTDNGGLTTHPAHAAAAPPGEFFGTSSGINVFSKTPAEGGKTVGDINNGDWIAFQPYRLGNVTSFSARVSSAGAGGTIQVRAGSATGTVLGSATVPVTGGWETFTNVTGAITNPPTGTTTLYLTFAGSGTGALYDVDAFTLTTGTPPTGGAGAIKVWAASAWTCGPAPPRTAPRSRSTPATPVRHRPGRSPRTRRSRRWASASTSLVAVRPTAPRSSSGPVTAPVRRTGPPRPTARCATRSPASASTSPGAAPPTARWCTCGPAPQPRTRSGSCPELKEGPLVNAYRCTRGPS